MESAPYFHMHVELNEEIGQSLVSKDKIKVSSTGWPRRLLTELGSPPLGCTTQCSKCKSYKPVYVVVHPRSKEYYPEERMCSCGNKLYKS
ncbi:EPIDERMAL PATTERNING FACTOR-like protein 6, partial [Mucuna pruriens]